MKSDYTPKIVVHQKHLRHILLTVNNTSPKKMKDIRKALSEIDRNSTSNNVWNMMTQLVGIGLVNKVCKNRYEISDKGLELLEVLDLN